MTDDVHSDSSSGITSLSEDDVHSDSSSGITSLSEDDVHSDSSSGITSLSDDGKLFGYMLSRGPLDGELSKFNSFEGPAWLFDEARRLLNEAQAYGQVETVRSVGADGQTMMTVVTTLPSARLAPRTLPRGWELDGSHWVHHLSGVETDQHPGLSFVEALARLDDGEDYDDGDMEEDWFAWLCDNAEFMLFRIAYEGVDAIADSSELQTDYDFMRMAVQIDGQALAQPDVGADLQMDRELALLAVKNDGMVLKHLYVAATYEDVVLAAIAENPMAAQFADIDSREPEVTLQRIVQEDGFALEYIQKESHSEPVVLAAVQQDGMALQFVDGTAITEAVALAAVQQDGMALQFVTATACTKAVALAAVTENGNAVKFLLEEKLVCDACDRVVGPNRVVGQRDTDRRLSVRERDRLTCSHETPCVEGRFCVHCARKIGPSILPPHQRGAFNQKELKYGGSIRPPFSVCEGRQRSPHLTEDLVVMAVTNCGTALEVVGAEMQRSKKVVLTAIAHSNGYALKWASRALRNDSEVVLEAVRLDDRALQFASLDLRADSAFMKRAVECNDRVSYTDEDVKNAQCDLEAAQKRRKQRNDAYALGKRPFYDTQYNGIPQNLWEMRMMIYGMTAQNSRQIELEGHKRQKRRAKARFDLGGAIDILRPMAAKIPDMQLLAAAAKLWQNQMDYTRQNTPELADLLQRQPVFVRLTAAEIVKLHENSLNCIGWLREDAFTLMNVYAKDIKKQLCTRDVKPYETLSINIGLGALQTRWCFCCGEFIRQQRVDRHVKARAHKRNVVSYTRDGPNTTCF